MVAVTEIPASRQSIYGTFSERAELVEETLDVWAGSLAWPTLSADKRHALRMIAEKVSRILNGDPTRIDSWADIGGYAQLVVDNLEAKHAELEDAEVPQ